MENTKIYAPWVIYFKQLEAFFDKDPDVDVAYLNAKCEVNLFVKGTAKADALSKLLPTEKTFGNVTLKINVIPANEDETDRFTLIKKAFAGNEAVSDIVEANVYGNDMRYVIFEKEVVQYDNDDISDFNGVCSTLYQDLAKELIGEDEGIYFCTEV